MTWPSQRMGTPPDQVIRPISLNTAPIVGSCAVSASISADASRRDAAVRALRAGFEEALERVFAHQLHLGLSPSVDDRHSGSEAHVDTGATRRCRAIA